MLLRILRESFLRRKRRKTIGILAVALGSSLATALIGISIEMGDKIEQQLKVYGSNIRVHAVEPPLKREWGPSLKEAYLSQKDLPRIKEIFWTNNIIDFAPFLSLPVDCQGKRIFLYGTWFSKELSNQQKMKTGIQSLFKFWKVEGAWPQDDQVFPQALMGKDLARVLNIHVGDPLSLKYEGKELSVKVVGLLDSGEEFDTAILVDLTQVQVLTGLTNAIHEIFVSALTIPSDSLEKTFRKSPTALSPQEYERWSCSPYVSSIARQIQEVFPHSVAEPILTVVQREGLILSKLKFLFIYICLSALLTAGIGFASTLMATVVERRQEVGLLRALGASVWSILLIFLSEMLVIAIVGSTLGGILGYLLGQMISFRIFETGIHPNLIVVFVVGGVTLLISILGGLFPLRTSLKLDPARVLHEN
ncbi:MAG: FtsX-like permease family protein [Chlamydiae bacterium]|nr:FtsX-like permease family protein [Chlamydiota bacterium]MBI3277591.1 FtsX-like permease family protein [Chlamydiota bacterium]